MDGKLLILCDEMPGLHNDGHKDYKIRDNRFLRSPNWYPEDLNSDKIFVSWDSIIPEDREFIELCKHYARFTEKPDSDFVLKQKGSIDPDSGTLKESMQEMCYYDRYKANLNYLSSLMQKGEDWQGMAMDLAVQYVSDANSDFFKAFTNAINHNGVVMVLPCFSEEKADSPITGYRMQLFEAWKNMNEMMKKSPIRESSEYTTAIIRKPHMYSDFGEVLYSKSSDELMEIYSMPIWGPEDPEDKKLEYDDGPDL